VCRPAFMNPFGFRLRLVCLLLLAAGVTPGCGGSERPTVNAPERGEFPVVISAPNGNVRIDRRPTRIVSLSPTATEILFAIGAGSQVVAVDENSSYPANAPRTKLSGMNPNIEALTTYNPDLVIYSSDSGGLGPGLQTTRVPGILQPAARHLNDTYAQIEQLGVATGHRGEAEGLKTRMRAEISKIVESRPRFKQRPTYYHELDETYFTATSQTFIGEIYALLDLRNIADEAGKGGGGYPQLSAEYIIKANPDLIFLADSKCCGQSAQTVAARPGWAQIRAVQSGATIPLDDDIASRWGPRTVDFLRQVADALKPLRNVYR
jgi:iron complex transport system substrate-binding protein